MDFQELAKQRYSVRRYAPEAVGAVALNMVLEAALCAPHGPQSPAPAHFCAEPAGADRKDRPLHQLPLRRALRADGGL